MKRLTKTEQLRLLKALPAHTKREIACHCNRMSGSGIGDILKSVARFLGPIAKEVGTVALKEFVMPLMKKKATDVASNLRKKYTGSGLKLAGQGRKRRKK